jgi:hypothetical protein
MKIALTRKNKNNNTTPRYKSSIAKKTYPITIAKLVPNFAARWRSICKYFSGQTTGKGIRKSNSNKKMPHAPTLQRTA